MYHIVDRLQIRRVRTLRWEERYQTIFCRPTPWRVFFEAFLGLGDFGLIDISEEDIVHFLNKTRPLSYRWEVLSINGREYAIRPFRFADMCKFCLESFQYGYIWKISKWRWR